MDAWEVGCVQSYFGAEAVSMVGEVDSTAGVPVNWDWSFPISFKLRRILIEELCYGLYRHRDAFTLLA